MTSLQEESHARLRDFAFQHPGREPETGGEFILLNQTRYDISPSVVILGCTLWSSLDPEFAPIISWSLNDFRRIKLFDVAKYARLHKEHLEWLNTTVENIRAQEPGKRVVIFTHHAPTADGTSNPKYIGGPTNSAFATELTGESVWKVPVSLWGFGHTHWSCDFVRDGVRVVSNQRGYFTEGEQGFDPSKVLEL